MKQSTAHTLLLLTIFPINLFAGSYLTKPSPRALNNLTAALKDIAKSKPKIIEKPAQQITGLLGPWMMQHHPDKIISYTTNFNNAGVPVYQIKVLRQWKGDCWIHALRNGLYIMDLAVKPRTDFNQIYNTMITRDFYTDFVKQSCPRPGFVTRKFIQEHLACIPNCVPEKSIEYIEQTLTFDFNPKVDEYTSLTNKFNMHLEIIDRLITIIHGLQQNKNCCFCINFSIAAINHGVTVVVHKYNDKIEYLFADSNNMSFRGDNYTWQEGRTTFTQGMTKTEYQENAKIFSAAINQIVSFVQNPTHFDDLMVKILFKLTMDEFNRQKEYNIKESGRKNWGYLADFAVGYLAKFYEALQRYGLLNNQLYSSTYKKMYCDILKKEQKEQRGSRDYNQLINLACT